MLNLRFAVKPHHVTMQFLGKLLQTTLLFLQPDALIDLP